MKLRNKIILIIVCALMAILLGSNKANAEVITGTEDSINWKFDTESGILTYSGTGTIEETWRQIDENYLSNVKTIVIEDGITGIGDCAFYTEFDEMSENILDPTSIEIPDSVTSIGKKAFWGCSGLTNINIPNGVTSIGEGAFSYCRGLTNINIPNGVTSIETNVFFDCSGLTSINIPNSVTSIGQYAFSGCRGLTGINIPNSVTSIGAGAFKDCIGLTSINIPNGVTDIGYNAFYACKSLTNIAIPNGVTDIGFGAFEGCTSLTSIIIPGSVMWIDYGTFSGCENLRSVTIQNGATEIGMNAFEGCKSLASITIPNSVTVIRGWAFMDCKSLRSITILNPKTDIGRVTDDDYRNPFINCHNELIMHCYKNSTVDKLAKEMNWKIEYLDDDGKSDGTSTNYTTLPTKTINNQKYITGINPEKNTVNEILSSSNFASGTTVKAYKYGQEISGDEKIGTGTVIKVFENGEEKTEYVAVVYGDTDGDGDMTAVDALAIVKNKTGEVPFTTDAQKEAAKISTKDDGEEAGAVDALAITLIIIGKANWNEKTGSVEYVGQSDDDVEAPTVSIDHELTLRQQ